MSWRCIAKNGPALSIQDEAGWASSLTALAALAPVVSIRGVVVLRQHPFFDCDLAGLLADLAAEAIQGPALPLQGVHHVKGCDSLAPGMLGVGDCIPDDVLQEHLQGDMAQRWSAPLMSC